MIGSKIQFPDRLSLLCFSNLNQLKLSQRCRGLGSTAPAVHDPSNALGKSFPHSPISIPIRKFVANRVSGQSGLNFMTPVSSFMFHLNEILTRLDHKRPSYPLNLTNNAKHLNQPLPDPYRVLNVICRQEYMGCCW